MPNFIGYIALYGFPLVVLLLFRRLSPAAALCWSIVLGYLFLPERGGLDLPVLPPFNKTLIPSLSAAVACFFVARHVQHRRRGVPASAPASGRGAPAHAPAMAGAPAPSAMAASAVAEAAPSRFRSARGQRLSDSGSAGYARSARVPGPDGAGLVPGAVPGIPDPGAGRADAGAGRSPASRSAAGRSLHAAGQVVTVGRRRARWISGLLLLVLVMPFLTMLQNGEAVQMGGRFLPGIRPYDAGSMVMEIAVMLLPFLLAQRFLATPEAHVTLMRVLIFCGLVYSLLILIEVRLSPQLNVWIYGFRGHSFAQHIRAGGYRPMVFLNHGLWVGIFIAMAVLSAFVLFRWSRLGARSAWLAAGVWLLVVLVLSKTIGALGITLALVPVLLLCGIRIQLLIAATIGMIVLFYPMLRGADLIPVERIHAMAAAIDADRAASLLYRLNNEDILLARANEKPLFGWGGWGRSLIYNERGESISVTDGVWIIIMGSTGWVGYIAQFGLLTLPLLALALSHRRLGLGLATSGLALVLTANLVDLLPNATLTPLTWLLAGALAGRYEMGRIAAEASPSDMQPAGTGQRRRGRTGAPPLRPAVQAGLVRRS